MIFCIDVFVCLEMICVLGWNSSSAFFENVRYNISEQLCGRCTQKSLNRYDDTALYLASITILQLLFSPRSSLTPCSLHTTFKAFLFFFRHRNACGSFRICFVLVFFFTSLLRGIQCTTDHFSDAFVRIERDWRNNHRDKRLWRKNSRYDCYWLGLYVRSFSK